MAIKPELPTNPSSLSLSVDQRLGNFHLQTELVLPACGVTGIFGTSGSGKTSLLRFPTAVLSNWANRYCWIPGAAFAFQLINAELGLCFRKPDSFLTTGYGATSPMACQRTRQPVSMR